MRCPGQDKRFWTPDDLSEVDCAHCGHALEFFKDEGIRRCPSCGKRVSNPKVSLGCAQWCAHAKECLGYDPKQGRPNDDTQTSLIDRLIEAMKAEFGTDQKRIRHALKVLDCAERILRTETADPRVVFAAAILHDIGIQEAERKHGSSAGKHQEVEGPPIARRILGDLDFGAVATEHVLQIIAHHHRGGFDSVGFRIVWDADNLVNASDECCANDLDTTRKHLARVLKTESGRLLAKKLIAEAQNGTGEEEVE